MYTKEEDFAGGDDDGQKIESTKFWTKKDGCEETKGWRKQIKFVNKQALALKKTEPRRIVHIFDEIAKTDFSIQS